MLDLNSFWGLPLKINITGCAPKPISISFDHIFLIKNHITCTNTGYTVKINFIKSYSLSSNTIYNLSNKCKLINDHSNKISLPYRSSRC